MICIRNNGRRWLPLRNISMVYLGSPSYNISMDTNKEWIQRIVKLLGGIDRLEAEFYSDRTSNERRVEIRKCIEDINNYPEKIEKQAVNH